VVIEGGTLIDGTGVPAVSGTTILIEDGRIQQIGQQGEVSIPADAHVIEAAGKYIIPGLIDSHVHYDMPWLHRLYLANGVTTVRDLGTSIERIVTLREEISVGNILAPRMFVSGVPINPRSVQAMNLGSSKEMAEKLVEAGVDGIKVTGYTPDELRDIVEVAHANGLIVYGHTERDWTESSTPWEFWKMPWTKPSPCQTTTILSTAAISSATGMVECTRS
jgi:imidazolonepropionase-like amidohydrolase